MTSWPEGAPCWADATFPDIDEAKNFYGELFGWSFTDSGEEFGHYTQAFSNGATVAALAPEMPGQEGMPPAWTLYFATPDARSTAARIPEAGGEVVMEPMTVGPFGTMAIARDPGGVPFGLWQPDSHTGFAKTGEPGSFCWAEVLTRDTEKADAFFPAVFGYQVQKMQDDEMDYRVWTAGSDQPPALGRMPMPENVPAEVPSYINVSFAVDDCDEALATVTRLGGSLLFGPEDSPFGRFATVADPAGAAFSMIDMNRTKGEMPTFA